MFGRSYIYSLGEELKYGANLYLSGWKKLVFHPLQVAKDTAYALYHPVQTGKILLSELKQHPVGMAVNISLSWITGCAVSTSINYLSKLSLNGASSSNIPTYLNNSTMVSESAISSISQVVQVGSQAMGGGCCGGICTTTVARISQTTSLISSQSASSENNREPIQQQSEAQVIGNGFSPYFNSYRNLKLKEECNDASCSIKQSSSQTVKTDPLKFK